MRPDSIRQVIDTSDAQGRKTYLHSILDSILVERERQDARHGEATERGYSLYRWVTVLAEEVGEVAEAVQDTPVPIRENMTEWMGLYTELIHVAAVAVAMAEVVLDEAKKEDHEDRPRT